jgi:hypothetical protein
MDSDNLNTYSTQVTLMNDERALTQNDATTSCSDSEDYDDDIFAESHQLQYILGLFQASTPFKFICCCATCADGVLEAQGHGYVLGSLAVPCLSAQIAAVGSAWHLVLDLPVAVSLAM